ncbi:MAG: DUF2849 domain-containing protein [Alphaproteobacteria bacterium]|mgnify:CR=1 FL=1|nr:DUF2849 domain-containing protein [Alphaproteobacteria bacterium]MDX5368007.1 DUF2849 domain-containing protein [Alphaproteobacteria bacterium]MDX5462854.1 DUF2849 domain-containing protein [Alphaproteobacteria bacterium]
MTQILTAQRLRDGRAVFRTPAGTWSEAMGEAAVFADKDAAREAHAVAEADVAANRIVDLYLVDLGPDGVTPVRLRERIRATGLPTAGNAL